MTKEVNFNTLEERVSSIPLKDFEHIYCRLRKKYHEHVNSHNSIYAYQYMAKIQALEELRTELYRGIERSRK